MSTDNYSWVAICTRRYFSQWRPTKAPIWLSQVFVEYHFCTIDELLVCTKFGCCHTDSFLYIKGFLIAVLIRVYFEVVSCRHFYTAILFQCVCQFCVNNVDSNCQHYFIIKKYKCNNYVHVYHILRSSHFPMQLIVFYYDECIYTRAWYNNVIHLFLYTCNTNELVMLCLKVKFICDRLLSTLLSLFTHYTRSFYGIYCTEFSFSFVNCAVTCHNSEI